MQQNYSTPSMFVHCEQPTTNSLCTYNQHERINESKLCMQVLASWFRSSCEYLIHHQSEFYNGWLISSPLSFKHMYVWCSFLDLHITTQHSNLSLRLSIVLPRLRHIYLTQYLKFQHMPYHRLSWVGSARLKLNHRVEALGRGVACD